MGVHGHLICGICPSLTLKWELLQRALTQQHGVGACLRATCSPLLIVCCFAALQEKRAACLHMWFSSSAELVVCSSYFISQLLARQVTDFLMTLLDFFFSFFFFSVTPSVMGFSVAVFLQISV